MFKTLLRDAPGAVCRILLGVITNTKAVMIITLDGSKNNTRLKKGHGLTVDPQIKIERFTNTTKNKWIITAIIPELVPF